MTRDEAETVLDKFNQYIKSPQGDIESEKGKALYAKYQEALKCRDKLLLMDAQSFWHDILKEQPNLELPIIITTISVREGTNWQKHYSYRALYPNLYMIEQGVFNDKKIGILYDVLTRNRYKFRYWANIPSATPLSWTDEKIEKLG